MSSWAAKPGKEIITKHLTPGPWAFERFQKDGLTGFRVRAKAEGIFGVVVEAYPQPLPVFVNEDNVRAIAAVPEMIEALEATHQCIVDFLEVYKSGGSMIVMDEAVKSLRDDALAKTRLALRSLQD